MIFFIIKRLFPPFLTLESKARKMPLQEGKESKMKDREGSQFTAPPILVHMISWRPRGS